jgi:hypothetical protein
VRRIAIGAGVARATAERDGKKLDSRGVHISHPDSEGRVKEFWAFSENTTAEDAIFSS